jgi:predicted TIM-barrel fold metal-dependent hydrolase
VELPKIISTDDHVVEPPGVWQSRLPARMREKGPRVERRLFAEIRMLGAGSWRWQEDPDGVPGDCWLYEDKVTYVHKAHVTIPNSALVGDDLDTFDKSQMVARAITYDEMRPSCYEPKLRVEDMERNWVDGSLCFPTFPRFCGQAFYEGEDKELGLACVRAYNDWMFDEWCGPSGGVLLPLTIVPLWDVELAAAEVRRNAERGGRAVCFSELPFHLQLPTIHSGYWDPFFAACNETGTVVCMHLGSSSKMPATSLDAPTAVQGILDATNSMASLADFLFSGVFIRFPRLKIAYSEGQIGWIPYALERADDVWSKHDNWMNNREILPEPPSTYYYDHVYGCFTGDRTGMRLLDLVGEDNITFETDFPHSDSTWPRSREYAEQLVAGVSDKVAYKVLRGNAIRMLELDRT